MKTHTDTQAAIVCVCVCCISDLRPRILSTSTTPTTTPTTPSAPSVLVVVVVVGRHSNHRIEKNRIDWWVMPWCRRFRQKKSLKKKETGIVFFCYRSGGRSFGRTKSASSFLLFFFFVCSFFFLWWPAGALPVWSLKVKQTSSIISLRKRRASAAADWSIGGVGGVSGVGVGVGVVLAAVRVRLHFLCFSFFFPLVSFWFRHRLPSSSSSP